MVIRAQIGDSPDMSLLILGLRLTSSVLLLGHIVDPALVLFAIGIDHWRSVSTAGVAFTLHVPLLLAIAANHVGVAGAIASERGGVDRRGGCWGTSRCRTRLSVLPDGGNFVKILIGDFIPEDCCGISFTEFSSTQGETQLCKNFMH